MPSRTNYSKCATAVSLIFFVFLSLDASRAVSAPVDLLALNDIAAVSRRLLVRGEAGAAVEAAAKALIDTRVCYTSVTRISHAGRPGSSAIERTSVDCSGAGTPSSLALVPLQHRSAVSSLLSTLGVALHRAHYTVAAAPILLGAARFSGCSWQDWANAGDVYLMALRPGPALSCFRQALLCCDRALDQGKDPSRVEPGRMRVLGKLHKASGWSLDWGQREGLGLSPDRQIARYLKRLSASARSRSRSRSRLNPDSTLWLLLGVRRHTNDTAAAREASEQRAVGVILQQTGGCTGLAALGECAGWGAPDRRSSMLAIRMARRSCSLGNTLYVGLQDRALTATAARASPAPAPAPVAVLPPPAGSFPSSADLHGLDPVLAAAAAHSEPLVRDDALVTPAAELRCGGIASTNDPTGAPRGSSYAPVRLPRFGLPFVPLLDGRGIGGGGVNTTGTSYGSRGRTGSYPRNLSVGFLSSDFGVHPVAQLVRGVIRDLAASGCDECSGPPCESVALPLKQADSWWGRAIAEEATRVVRLWDADEEADRDGGGAGGADPAASRGDGKGDGEGGHHPSSAWQQVQRIAGEAIDVLIELNGHTMGSGLSLLAARLAPVQATWLGHWQSTGGLDVDYFLADADTAPPDVLVTPSGRGITEGLVLLPLPSLFNDYASAQRHVALRAGALHAGAQWRGASSHSDPLGIACRLQLRRSESRGVGVLASASASRGDVRGLDEAWREGRWAALAELLAPDGTGTGYMQPYGYGYGYSLPQPVAGGQMPLGLRLGVEWALRSQEQEQDGEGGYYGADDGPSETDGRSPAPHPWVVLATFCGFGKWTPAVVDAWAALLRLQPRSVLWVPRHAGWEEAGPRARAELEARGVAGHRLLLVPKAAWLQHIEAKGGATDLALDTAAKNGHTSSLDALWGGVPLVTLRGQGMAQRLAGSMVDNAVPWPSSTGLGTRPLADRGGRGSGRGDGSGMQVASAPGKLTGSSLPVSSSPLAMHSLRSYESAASRLVQGGSRGAFLLGAMRARIEGARRPATGNQGSRDHGRAGSERLQGAETGVGACPARARLAGGSGGGARATLFDQGLQAEALRRAAAAMVEASSCRQVDTGNRGHKGGSSEAKDGHAVRGNQPRAKRWQIIVAPQLRADGCTRESA